MRYGFGLRFLAAGPMLQKDLGDLEIRSAAAATMYPHLATNNAALSPAQTRPVAQGKLETKSDEDLCRRDEPSTAAARPVLPATVSRGEPAPPA